jgi:polysaccharide biosynthesis transport protein
MHFSDHLPLYPSHRSHNPEERKSTPDPSANLRRLEFKRETLTNAGIITLTVIASVLLSGSLPPQESPPQYEGKFQFVVEPLVNQKKTSEAKKAVTTEWAIDYETQARVLTSPKVVSPIVRRLQVEYPALDTQTLLRNLTVTHEPGSNRLLVTYRDFDRKKAQAILNQLAHSYLSFSQACHGGSCRAIQFIDQRLPQLQQQMAEVEQSLKSFQKSTGITNPKQFGQHLTQWAQILVQRENELQIQMAEAHARALILQQRLGLGNQPLADDLLQRHPRYQALLEKLRQVVTQFYLVLDHPQGEPSSLKELQQRYQHLSSELSEAAQDAALHGVSAIQSSTQLEKDSSEVQMQTLQEWMAVTHQTQVIRIQKQAIAQSEQRVQNLVQQWAVSAREYDAIQLKLQTINSQVKLYQQRKEELKNQPDSQLSARLVASPETVKVMDETSWLWGNLPLLIEFTVPLSLLLIIQALAATKKNRIADSNQQTANVQPGATLQKPTPKQSIGMTYYRWFFEKLASTSVVSFKKPSPASNSKFRTILRRLSDRSDYQELLVPLAVRLSEPMNFEFGIANRLHRLSN